MHNALITRTLLVTTLSCFLLFCGNIATKAQSQLDSLAAFVHVDAPMAIDGNPVDWAGLKASQAITLPGRPEAVAWCKLAYDTENAYALFRVVDASPLKNSSTVFQELLKGGDAISLCFGPAAGQGTNQRVMLAQVNGKPEVLVMRPQWSEKSHPYTYFTAAAGKVPMDSVWHLPEARATFVRTADGYLAELAIPWKALGLTPTPGYTFPFDAEIIFSDPAGRTNTSIAWWHSASGDPFCVTDIATEARLYPDAWGRGRLYLLDPGQRVASTSATRTPTGVPITFTLPRDAKVTVNIMDNTGWVVREILRVNLLTKGTHTIYWDGRDRWGSPMAPGKYRYRVAYFDGIKTTFAASIGNSGRPPYRTPEGTGSIGGVHSGPQAVGADADGIYMLNGGEEGQPCLRKIDPNTGNVRWFASTGTFGGGQAITADAQYAYMVYKGPYSNGARFVRLDEKTGQPTPIGEKHDPLNLGDIDVAGVTVTGGFAYYSEAKANRLGTINLTTGEFGKDIAIPSPSGVYARQDGTLLVCSATNVLVVNPTTGEQHPFLTGLTSPRAVAVDAAGITYVSDLGSSQQIKKYNAGGNLLGTIGVAGGRAINVPDYDPLAFNNVTGLTLGPDGNLWIVEQSRAPRRYAKLTREGKWLEDFYGPNNCGFIVDLDDPTTIYYGSNNWDGTPSLKWVKCKIDYAAYAKSPDSSKGFAVTAIETLSPNGNDYSAEPDLFTGQNTPGQNVWGETLRGYIFTGTTGKRYLFRSPGLWIWDENRWKPAAILDARWKDQAIPYWTDTNGDGLVQQDEIAKGTVPLTKITWMSRDLVLYGMEGTLKPAHIDARGVPSYAGGVFTPFFKDKFSPIAFNYDNSAFSPGNDVITGPPGADGAIYYSNEMGPPNGHGFWDRYSEGRIIRTKDGKVQWIVGHHSENGDNGNDGDTMRLSGITGELDGVVLFNDINGNFVAYSTDGLCLGWALTDGKGHPAIVGPNAIYIENMATGAFFKDPVTKKRLLVSWSTEDIRVMEVSGAFGSDITRIDGSITLPSASSRTTPGKAQCTIPYSTQTINYLSYNSNPDGYDYEWAKDVPAFSFMRGTAMVADLRLRRDAGTLCVFADVAEPPTFPAAAGLNPTTLYGHVGGIELLLGPAGSKDATKPGLGDTRIFLTGAQTADGWLTGYALVCRPSSTTLLPTPELRALDANGNFTGAISTAPFHCETGLQVIPGAVVKVKERQDRRGYRLEAMIPLALFPELTKRVPVVFNRPNAQNSFVAISDTRPDFAGPFRFNAAVWVTNGATGLQRIPWQADGMSTTDAKSFNPSTWGWANLQKDIRWDEMTGVPACNLYRGITPDPQSAVLVKNGVSENHITDTPGLGTFYYWLAPVDAHGEGQWLGPLSARDGKVNFGSFVAQTALSFEKPDRVYAYPGRTSVVNIASTGVLTIQAPDGVAATLTRRDARSWSLLITLKPGTPVGTTLTLPLFASINGKTTRSTLTVVAAPVPVNAYQAMADVITNAGVSDITVDSLKPADGATGHPAMTQDLAGNGTLSQHDIGAHGYVIFRFQGKPGSLRKVQAPFVDTFANDGMGESGWGNLLFTVDGVSSIADPNSRACVARAGGNGVLIKTTDSAEHVLTVMSTTFFGVVGPSRYTVSDEAGTRQWVLADLDGTQGQTIVQFRFTGTIRLTVTQTGPGNCANISALFLD